MDKEKNRKQAGDSMHHFFVDASDINTEEKTIRIAGENLNHLKNVLRVRIGERVLLSAGEGTDYVCTVQEIGAQEIITHIDFQEEEHELPMEICLFQGLPKSDKMEFIIQKAVELGASRIIPVETKNAVVRLDEKKAAKKTERWQSIAEAAAKQSKRSIIPEVGSVLTWKEAMQCMPEYDIRLIPYENARGMAATLDLAKEICEAAREQKRLKIAVFIGPEGGFSETEIRDAEGQGIVSISLGKRILRTETAAIVSLSALMLLLETACIAAE